jgi:hypothetical protein
MIGFFEHQYISYKKNHIKNLLALAKVDGHMHPKEEALLYKIGKGYGLKEWQIKELVEADEKFEVIVPDNHNDKMNLLYDLIWMVFADEVIDRHEIEFCEDAVKNFGLKKECLLMSLKKVHRHPLMSGRKSKNRLQRNLQSNSNLILSVQLL